MYRMNEDNAKTIKPRRNFRFLLILCPLLFFLLNHDCNLDICYGKSQTAPEIGIFHPKSDKIFSDFEEYLSWYKKAGLYKKNGFWVGIPDCLSHVSPGKTGEIVSCLINKLEEEDINVLPVYSPSLEPYLAIEEFFYDAQGQARIDLIASFSFKMTTFNDKRSRDNLIKLGVPILDAIRVYYYTIPQWKEGIQGLPPKEITWQICHPEYSGLIEPSVLGAKAVPEEQDNLISEPESEVYVNKPIEENITFFIKRIKAWRNLQVKANKDKRIAIIYWNHSPGKQNVGASYLNVFRSLEVILKKMREEGYFIEGELPSEEEIKELVLKSGRNIGSWVPGELDELLKSKRVVRWSVSDYLKSYDGLNENYRKKLEEQWGSPEESDIMVKNNEFIIPCVPLGNVILLPQPSRGWGDDPVKLYHSPTVWPHHQYTAFYLWLRNEFKADAIISLGKHGTHEWLPGKQAGLSQSCPPEVLIQDLPNIYPYIVDNIGEGIQAKRRGRGVIIDHLIPVLKKAGSYEEYRDLATLIDEYNSTIVSSAELAEEKLKRIRILVKKLGLDKDLLLEEVDEDAVEEIEHYLLELQEEAVPYGMHTLGVSPVGEELESLSGLI
ncbi:MAG: cobaltochelatase subunit CobN, partial [Candidatus Omnitrophica bacterium]|nr:cobaltochelatase subunit CobN [Candidatus Omnitrophota bacterium]